MGQLRYGRECYQPHKQKEQQEGISTLRCRHRGDKIKARGHWEQEPLWAHLMEADTVIAKNPTRAKRREKCPVFSRRLCLPDPWWRFTLAVLLEEAQEMACSGRIPATGAGKELVRSPENKPRHHSPMATLPGASGFPVLQFMGADSSQWPAEYSAEYSNPRSSFDFIGKRILRFHFW